MGKVRFDHIKGKFHRLPIVSGWATYGKALREQGAIVAVKYKLPMVNTDVIPEELSNFVLEHEAVESALDINASDTQNQIAFEKVDQLGLTKAIKVSRPRWNHIFATVRQLRLAQKENKLDKMMQFADELESRPENKSEAFGNKELRDAIYSLLTTAV